MKISLICRIKTKQCKEIILYAIEAPHPLHKKELKKCATLVERAYDNGSFNESQPIVVNKSYKDTFRMTGIYISEKIPQKDQDKLSSIIGAALHLSGLNRKELSEEIKAIYLTYEPIVQLSKIIDEWIINNLSNFKNVNNKLDN